MSTVAGALNSISTLFSYDLYKRFRPQASDHQLVLVGRLTAGVALVAAIGLVPLLDEYPSIFNGLNDIIAHIAPPITTVFVLGVFWRGASAQSAKLTLWLGSLLGAATYVAGKLGSQYLGEGNVTLAFLEQTPFMMKAFYLLCACVIMQVAFSFIYPVEHTPESEKLYWSSPWEPLRAKGWPGIGNYKLLALLLVGGMSALYYWFH
jgi:SSS family solute:Na+ symporter